MQNKIASDYIDAAKKNLRWASRASLCSEMCLAVSAAGTMLVGIGAATGIKSMVAVGAALGGLAAYAIFKASAVHTTNHINLMMDCNRLTTEIDRMLVKTTKYALQK